MSNVFGISVVVVASVVAMLLLTLGEHVVNALQIIP